MSFTHPQSLQLRTAIYGILFALLQQSRLKTTPLAEIVDFAPTSGPIEAQQFFKIQAQTRPEKPDPHWQLWI